MASIKSKILVIDDEKGIHKMLKVIIEAKKYKYEPAYNAVEGINLANSLKPDLILLDLGLPDLDGLEVIPEIRNITNSPILILSARDCNDTISLALDTGADDYITKPFSTEVLLARVKANLRKHAINELGNYTISNGRLFVDLMKHQVFLDDKEVRLSPREYDLLKLFLKNKGRMLKQDEILQEIWGKAYVDNSQYLRVYTGHLRQKIEADPDNPEFILTKSGVGYMMKDHEENNSEEASYG